MHTGVMIQVMSTINFRFQLCYFKDRNFHRQKFSQFLNFSRMLSSQCILDCGFFPHFSSVVTDLLCKNELLFLVEKAFPRSLQKKLEFAKIHVLDFAKFFFAKRSVRKSNNLRKIYIVQFKTSIDRSLEEA